MTVRVPNQQRDTTLDEVKALIQGDQCCLLFKLQKNAVKDQRLVVKTNIRIAENVMITVDNLGEQHTSALIDLANALSTRPFSYSASAN